MNSVINPISFDRYFIGQQIDPGYGDNKCKYISPIYFDPMPLLINEYFVPITDIAVPGIKPYYLISNYGRIYNRKTGLFIKCIISDNGYYNVRLSVHYNNKTDIITCKVHRLVALMFNYNPYHSQLVVNHKDGIKTNNHISNLEWVTNFENLRHARINNLSKNTPEEIVHEICKKIQNKESLKDISKELNINYSVIREIHRGTHYTYISKEYNFEAIKTPNKKLSDEVVKIIKVKLKNGEKICHICRELNIDKNPVKDIRRGKTYKNIIIE